MFVQSARKSTRHRLRAKSMESLSPPATTHSATGLGAWPSDQGAGCGAKPKRSTYAEVMHPPPAPPCSPQAELTISKLAGRIDGCRHWPHLVSPCASRPSAAWLAFIYLLQPSLFLFPPPTFSISQLSPTACFHQGGDRFISLLHFLSVFSSSSACVSPVDQRSASA